MKLTAEDLLSLGVIDEIIKEALGGAHRDVDFTARNIKQYISKELKNLIQIDKNKLIDNRYKKFRQIGIWK